MKNVVMVLGSDIYEAAIAGAGKRYNRANRNVKLYEEGLKECYQSLLQEIDDDVIRKDIQRNTLGDWRRAYLPLAIAIVHSCRKGRPCESHARVYLANNPASVFDIPMDYWIRFEKEDVGTWAEEM
jgi:hypothetical protein